MSGKKFRGKYRIDSVRMKNYDYSQNASYFVTILTKNRENFFGEIVNQKMQLSEIGKIVEYEWYRTPEIRPDMNITLDQFVIMPNHIHGIIVIGDNQYNSASVVETPCIVETQCIASLRPASENEPYKNDFGPQRKILSSIIRGFKSAVTKKSREKFPGFAWQSRFHDHIIRNEKSLNRIRQYIIKNPELWHRDRNNPNLTHRNNNPLT